MILDLPIGLVGNCWWFYGLIVNVYGFWRVFIWIFRALYFNKVLFGINRWFWSFMKIGCFIKVLFGNWGVWGFGGGFDGYLVGFLFMF